MRHLTELGHRRIAVIRGPEELFDSEPRWAGVQRAAAETPAFRLIPTACLSTARTCQIPTSGFEGGLRFAKEMLASGRPFTAVLAFDDLTALGVVRGLTEAGLRVPEDCSVVGFDDVLPASRGHSRHHHHSPAAERDGLACRRSGCCRRSMRANKARESRCSCTRRRPNWWSACRPSTAPPRRTETLRPQNELDTLTVRDIPLIQTIELTPGIVIERLNVDAAHLQWLSTCRDAGAHESDLFCSPSWSPRRAGSA